MLSPSARLRAKFPPLATAAAAVAVLTLTLAACGGGGGGATPNVGTPTPPTPPPDITNPPPPPAIMLPAPNPPNVMDYRDDEFNRNWGLGAINADAAYQRGYWGQGVTVAVVDSGALASHNDLSANIVTGRRFNRAGDALTSYAGEDPSGHGTHIAGIVGGARDGSRFHGIAPSVRIMPLRIAADSAGNELNGNVAAAFRYAMDNNVRILNNGWNDEGLTLRGTYHDTENARFTQTHDILMPWTEAALALPFSTAASVRVSISAAASAIGDDDVAVVFGAGDRQWNGLSYIRLCGGILSADECTDHRDNFFKRSYDIVRRFQVSWIVGVPVLQHKRVSITMYNPFTVTVDGRQTVLRWEASSPAAYGLAPIYHPTVRGRWIAAVGVERHNNTLRIANSSNGCGDKAKYWCIAAPGAGITSAYNSSDTAERELGGTPMAAAHVSGALALLKSRFPDMPMSVLVAVLFNTAKDIGEPGADAVYGHGLLDISTAITVTDESLIALPTLWPLNPFDTRNCTGCRVGEFEVNYGLGTINADAAYYRNYWGQGVTVAVVDSGVRGSHVNLSANVLANLARRFDRDGNAHTNGALDDPVTTRGDYYVGSHGTGVAGVIAGVRGNDRGGGYGHGVAPSASILPLRFSESQLITIERFWGSAATFPLGGDENAAFRYAVNNNVQIINNSWGAGFNYFGHYGGDTAATLAFQGPILPPLWQVPGLLDDFRRNIETKANIFRGEDVAVVWAAGNEYWNSEATCRNRLGTVCIKTYEVPSYVQTQLYPTPRERATYTPAELIDNFVMHEIVGGKTISIALSGGSRVTVNGRAVTISAFEPDGVGDYPLAPMWFPSLRGKWLAVAATDSRNRIAWLSNGCGSIAKHWCLAAPGVDISIAHAATDTFKDRRNGTSFAAPHVSGALALMKSRLQNMPMSVLIAILLSTATDLGAAGVDDVYGHGLVNISAAITVQNNAQVVTRNNGVLLKDAKTELPPSFGAFAKRAGEVKAAVRYLNGFYYDAPLKNLLKTSKAKNTPLNFAAGVFDDDNGNNNQNQKQNGAFAFAEDGELREVGLRGGMFQVRHNWHSAPSLWSRVGGVSTRPFYANGKGNSGEMRFNFGAHLAMFAARGKEELSRYRQLGLLWRRDFSQTGMALSFSRIDEDDTLLGGEFGGAMPLADGGRIMQIDIAGYLKLGDNDKWRGYANYRRADINANIGGIVRELSGARAEGWQLGLSARDWFREGDSFRIGVGRDIALSGGEAILRYGKSANPQTDANTQITHNRGYRTEEKHIDLSEDSPLSFSLGYGFKPNENSRLSFGANIRRAASSSFSIDWRWEIKN